MRKIKMRVGTNFYGSNVEEVVEFEDDATEEDIDEYFRDWVWNNIDSEWWEEVE